MNPFQIATFLLGIAAQAIATAIKLKENSAQDSEWTEEQSDAFDKQLADAKNGVLPHWVVEPNPTD